MFSNAYFKYSGEYVEGSRDGRGTFSLGNGTEIEGDFEEGEFVGDAVVRYGNGDVYQGGFGGGERNGLGEFTSTGARYKGEWRNGARHGTGLWEDFITGKVIEGAFEDNKPHGKCEVRSLETGDLVYVGEMKKGLMSGNGKLMRDRYSYEGEFEPEVFHGEGELVHKNGYRYKGTFKEGNTVLTANKLLISFFKEEFILPQNAQLEDDKSNSNTKKDGKETKTLAKDQSAPSKIL